MRASDARNEVASRADALLAKNRRVLYMAIMGATLGLLAAVSRDINTWQHAAGLGLLATGSLFIGAALATESLIKTFVTTVNEFVEERDNDVE